ncbi:hypothetical protein MEG_01207 [Bartonella tamiae Th307]|uniref:Protein SlyX homolog n=2 Tax=Bartonella tamiae TaxID=373638 RepID=J0QW82_9HYPH|nr:hypothetical protein ME5_00677 [Bartonella tamiae Th239]EJF93783.1 hypothetical protein MEG_01207 [Bartonella tamiae Th307]
MMYNMVNNERLVELEIKVSEQEKTIDELSSVLAQQWKTIERIEHQLTLLTKRFVHLEEQIPPDIPITKPPHY